MGIQLELMIRIKINRVWVWGIGIWGFDLSCRAFEHPNMIALICSITCVITLLFWGILFRIIL